MASLDRGVRRYGEQENHRDRKTQHERNWLQEESARDERLAQQFLDLEAHRLDGSYQQVKNGLDGEYAAFKRKRYRRYVEYRQAFTPAQWLSRIFERKMAGLQRRPGRTRERAPDPPIRAEPMASLPVDEDSAKEGLINRLGQPFPIQQGPGEPAPKESLWKKGLKRFSPP